MHFLRSSVSLLRRAAIGLAIVIATTGSVLGLLAWSDAHAQAGASPPSTQVTPVATAASTAKTWSIRIDEAALTRDVNAWVAAQAPFDTPLGSARLHDLSVQLSSDQVLVQGTADIGGASSSFALSAGTSIESGRVLVHVRTARLGGIGVPDVARAEIEHRLQDQLDQSIRTFRVVVQSVSTADGALAVQGSQQ
jgi:hypothetical protein